MLSSPSKMPWQRRCIASSRSAETLKSSRGSLITLAIPSSALAIEWQPCAEKRNGRYRQIYATTSRSMLADTLQQTLCVACVRQPSRKRTVGIAQHCQIMRSKSASTAATKFYEGEVLIAYSRPTRSIVLFAIILISIRRAKPQRSGGPEPLHSTTF